MNNPHLVPRSDIIAIQKDMLRVERLRVFTLEGKADTSDIYAMTIEEEISKEFEAKFN